MSTPDAQQFRVQVQAMIVRIITSGAPCKRMNQMLRSVHKDEAWDAIRKELAALEGGEGRSY